MSLESVKAYISPGVIPGRTPLHPVYWMKVFTKAGMFGYRLPSNGNRDEAQLDVVAWMLSSIEDGLTPMPVDESKKRDMDNFEIGEEVKAENLREHERLENAAKRKHELEMKLAGRDGMEIIYVVMLCITVAVSSCGLSMMVTRDKSEIQCLKSR